MFVDDSIEPFTFVGPRTNIIQGVQTWLNLDLKVVIQVAEFVFFQATLLEQDFPCLSVFVLQCTQFLVGSTQGIVSNVDTSVAS